MMISRSYKSQSQYIYICLMSFFELFVQVEEHCSQLCRDLVFSPTVFQVDLPFPIW